MTNLATSPDHKIQTFSMPNDRSIDQTIDRLDALLMVLKSCKGEACTNPWKVLHPAGDVPNLSVAMYEQYDDFYAKQPKVSFDKCELGYIVGSEGPQTPNYYGSGSDYAEWT